MIKIICGETCLEAKLAKTPLHLIEKNSNPLELIQSDVRNLTFLQTRAGEYGALFEIFFRLGNQSSLSLLIHLNRTVLLNAIIVLLKR